MFCVCGMMSAWWKLQLLSVSSYATYSVSKYSYYNVSNCPFVLAHFSSYSVLRAYSFIMVGANIHSVRCTINTLKLRVQPVVVYTVLSLQVTCPCLLV